MSTSNDYVSYSDDYSSYEESPKIQSCKCRKSIKLAMFLFLKRVSIFFLKSDILIIILNQSHHHRQNKTEKIT